MKPDIKALNKEQYLIPVKIILAYLVWKVFHHFATIPGTALNQHWDGLIYDIGCVYARATGFILSTFGMSVAVSGINVDMLVSYRRILVQEHCLAIPAMVIFTGAVLFFKGTWRDKAWFLAAGLAGIIAINTLRLVLVSLAWAYLSEYFFKLHHAVVYVIVMYGFIFYMIAWWMNRTIRKSNSRIPAQ